MKRRVINLLIAVVMFSASIWLDSHLRTSAGGFPNCWCLTFKCRVVKVADQPLLILTRPIETAKFLFLWS